MPDYARYLDDLESRIIPAQEDRLWNQWKSFLDGGCTKGIFYPCRPQRLPSRLPWPDVGINETLADCDKMLYQHVRNCSLILEQGSGRMMGVRCNYGTGILPSVFGARLFMMDDEMNTLPTSWPLDGGQDTIRRLLDAGVPDLTAGFGASVFEMAQRYVDAMREYPLIRAYVAVYHPDLQGPMDVCELLWGSNLFLDVTDEPELVTDFLGLITDTYIAFMEEWNRIVPRTDREYSVHWDLLHKGTIMLRDDSAMNFSPEMFREFILPFNKRILDHFGGGAMHYCGKGDHFVPIAAEMDTLHSVNLSQPEYNDMDTIYAHTVDKDITVLKLDCATAEAAIRAGRDLRGMVHCV